jgi:peptidyl-prolyl cis-trans isomerase C
MRRIMVLLVLLTAGCSRESELSDDRSPASPQQVSPPIAAAPADVIVEVDGRKLMRAEVEREIASRLDPIRSQLAPEEIPPMRRRIRDAAVERFVMQALLLAEAGRHNVTVSSEEEAKAFEEIRGRLAPGTTLEQVLKNSPRGEEAMRNEVLNGIVVNKFVSRYLEDKLDVSDEEIAAAQEKHAGSLPETIRARHILIAVAPDDSPEVRRAKRQKCEAIRVKLLEGADFADTARQHSDCPSKQRGGDLGPFPRDRMVKAFSEAAFAQEIGEIGPVVESPDTGYHIIQVLEHNKAGSLPREKIVSMIRNRKQQAAMAKLLQELAARAVIRDYREAVSGKR